MNNTVDERGQFVVKRRKYTNNPDASRASRRRLCGNGNNNNNKNDGGGLSTTLKLYEDPWNIKKKLTDSDLGISSRLLLATDLVKSQILPMLGPEHALAVDTEEGTAVRVWDLDSKSMHQLVLKRWSSSKSYVFISKWNQDFVRRRELKKGDEIGFHWDPFNSFFNFCVLKRAATSH